MADIQDEDESTTMNTSKHNSTLSLEDAPTLQVQRKIQSSISSMGRGVCRIEVVKVEWHPLQPWQRMGQTKSSGTGFCITGERILTNAHVVKSAVDIRVRLFGSTRRYPATVLVYAPEVDLALLDLDVTPSEKSAFFSVKDEVNGDATKCRRTSIALELADELPALQDTVQVVGYPTGGKTICVTEGVVSRIDVLQDTNVVIQVDSAINPGNSGGPALNRKGQVTGVAFRKRTSTTEHHFFDTIHVAKSSAKLIDNIGYLIPSVVVRAFLHRIQEPKPSLFKNRTGPLEPPQALSNTSTGSLPSYALAPTLPYKWHSLENHSLRLAHKVPDDVQGILITSVCAEVIPDPQDLQEGDILTQLDEHLIADDGQVRLRGDEFIQHTYWIKVKRQGDPFRFRVYRNGKYHTSKPITLKDIPYIIPRWENVDCQPNYLLVGACVFLPYTATLRHSSKCGTLLKADGIRWCRTWPNEWGDQKELIILTDLLAHELTFSYQRRWRRLLRYNGVDVTSLSHLRHLWQESCSRANLSQDKETAEPLFVRLELEHDDDVVLEVNAAKEAEAQVMATYEIPKSSQILPANPNYRY